MNYCTIILTLQFCLLCRCNSKISFISGNSNNFIEILAKQQINEDFDSIYSRQGTKSNDYSVVVSDDDNTDRRPKYQPQYSADHGAAAGNYQQGQHPQQLNPLLKQASSASIGILFVLLIWRSLASYELADQFNSGTFRLLAVTPTVLILIANLMGFIINVMKPFNFKNFLKFILALNITREFIELLYNAAMLVVNSSNSQIPREVYFGRFFMNVWWLSLCITFSKSRWVASISLPSGQGQPNVGSNSYYQQQQQQQQQQAQRNYQQQQQEQ
jgi:hypothetical protein